MFEFVPRVWSGPVVVLTHRAGPLSIGTLLANPQGLAL
jgi:hypothetical protein